MPKNGVEYLAQHPGWKTEKVKHGVFLVYGKQKIKLKAKDLEMITNALEIINPDTEKARLRAFRLFNSFAALTEYAESVHRG